MDKVYDFQVVRSGDGKVFPLGKGTLAQGEKLVKRFDRLFEIAAHKSLTEAERKILRNWEGCDVCAVCTVNASEILYYMDGWETV